MKTFGFDKLLNILPTATTQRLLREEDVGVGRRLGCRPERESPAPRIVEWHTAPAFSGRLYPAEARSVVMLFRTLDA
jgi:hypothetical protein